jgi:hypothetical protein
LGWDEREALEIGSIKSTPNRVLNKSQFKRKSMNNMYPGSDLEGDARDSADLQIAERVPQPRRLEMPIMSDNMLYLRLNLPDGLRVGSHEQTKLDYSAQNEHAHGQTGIKQEGGR